MLEMASGLTVTSGPTGTAFDLLLGPSVSLADVHDPHPRTAQRRGIGGGDGADAPRRDRRGLGRGVVR
jgi:hypothetical protein